MCDKLLAIIERREAERQALHEGLETDIAALQSKMFKEQVEFFRDAVKQVHGSPSDAIVCGDRHQH